MDKHKPALMLNQAEKLLQQGQSQQALPLLEQYAANQPQDVRGWLLLVIALHQSHKLQEALHALESVLAIEPHHLQARNIKAVVLCDLGKPQEAIQVYREALTLAPGDAALLLNMAIVLEQAGDSTAALEHYDLLLKHHPEHASALLNRGALLLSLGSLQEALHNNRQLATAHSNWEHAHFNLGETLLALEQWQPALAAYTRALAIQPAMAKAHFGHGLALSMLQRFAEAQQALNTAQSLDPAAFEQNKLAAAARSGGQLHEFNPQVIYLLKQALRLSLCDWSHWQKLGEEIEALTASAQHSATLNERALLFHSFALPLSPASRFTLARNIAARITERVKPAVCPAFEQTGLHRGKIKIGYVSPDFRKHPTATLSRRLYALHDRSRYEIYGYSLRPDDGSPIRREIEQSCDVFRELSSLDDHASAEIIRRDGIDILIDLAGYTSFARAEIFAMRPAPLQLCYLGFPHSTGADFIDYFIADPVVIPPSAEKYFSEKIAHLPDSYFLFDNQQAIAPLKLTRGDLDLPPHGTVFCCHNSNYKITPDVFDSWMRILQRVPDSVIWLLDSSVQARDHLCREAELRGIVRQRLVFADFVSNDIHLARYRLADLFLDTFQCNAHTTAAEALWSGLPVLTCAGNSMAARVAASLLSAVGLHELITTSPQQYEDKAVYLATHADELKRLRALLESNRLTTPLFDTERQVKNIEAVYQHIWNRHRAGLPPETFHSGE
ncbi:MAG TPA: tetratricopeptide repeat protein [Gallionellaceae bacterium]|nr:tetratricopeptide repeat protein [Gallionellaceae bacterium]HQS73820.1 tetratricopeptide repeat protein [Gallionellaceae bacterium]